MQKHKRFVLTAARELVSRARFCPNKPVSVLCARIAVLLPKSSRISPQPKFSETTAAVTIAGDIVIPRQRHRNSFKGHVLIIINYNSARETNAAATGARWFPPCNIGLVLNPVRQEFSASKTSCRSSGSPPTAFDLNPKAACAFT